MKRSLLSITITSALMMLSSSQVQAHGWSEYPEARQQTCYSQGNFWGGTPSNPGCAQALSISGTYPFVQRNEYSMNVTDYNNMQAVKEAIPDGTLCYANDPQKRGMGAPSDEWTRTSVKAGTFEYVFNATAPHNPSFWQFYLTKPDADLSKALAWDDLELIQEEGNIPVVNSKYKMDVTIPSDRAGDAILFVRWQRVDAAGEGFYNCSDINIVNDDVVVPPTDPTPDPVGPYLVQGTSFIPQSVELNSAAIGDTVHYKVFNKNGEQHSSFSININADNKNDWDRLLASKVNGWYESNHQGNVFIGRWHEEMNHYMYFKNDLHGNYFNSKDSRASGEFSITTETNPITAVISPNVLRPLDNATVIHGDHVILQHNESEGESIDVQWLQTSGTPLQTTLGPNNELIIETADIDDARQEFTFKLVISNSDAVDEEVYSFVVVPSTTEPETPVDPSEPEMSTWDVNQVYRANDVVTHNGKTWTAQWETRGEEPGTTGQWGVWR